MEIQTINHTVIACLIREIPWCIALAVSELSDVDGVRSGRLQVRRMAF